MQLIVYLVENNKIINYQSIYKYINYIFNIKNYLIHYNIYLIKIKFLIAN